MLGFYTDVCGSWRSRRGAGTDHNKLQPGFATAVRSIAGFASSHSTAAQGVT